MLSTVIIEFLIRILLIAGAINWGSIALSGRDLVKMVVGSGQTDRIVKLAVGVAGVLSTIDLVKASVKKDEV